MAEQKTIVEIALEIANAHKTGEPCEHCTDTGCTNAEWANYVVLTHDLAYPRT